MVKKIPWWHPKTGTYERKFIDKVLISNYPNEGKYTELFEQKISRLLNAKYIAAVPSGTVALFLALKGLGIKKGDEVIVPDLCFIAAPNAVDLTGAKPVLVDINPNTLSIDPNKFEEAITKRTKVVIPVHISGKAVDMISILKISKQYGLQVVEDACEAFMSKHRGQYLGTFGDVGCLSFSPAKTITTGQGGAIIANSRKLYKRIKELKDQGRVKRGTGGDDIHDSIGYNFKFSNLQAAFGLGQLYYLNSRINRMRRNHMLYVKNLKGTKGISVFECNLKEGELPLWTDVLVEDRDRLDKYLKDNNIESNRFWLPLHSQKPYYQPNNKFKISTKLSPKLLWLPSSFTLTDADINYVCKHIKSFMSGKKIIK